MLYKKSQNGEGAKKEIQSFSKTLNRLLMLVVNPSVNKVCILLMLKINAAFVRFHH